MNGGVPAVGGGAAAKISSALPYGNAGVSEPNRKTTTSTSVNYMATPKANRLPALLYFLPDGPLCGYAIKFNTTETGNSTTSGLFAVKGSKTYPRRLLKSVGREECKHRILV
jgi:hypothetical protein